MMILSVELKAISFHLLIALPLVLLTPGANAADYEMSVMQDQPIAYWRFDEDDNDQMLDSSGNGNHGTYFGGPLRNTGAGYGTGTSLNLDGNDYGEATITIGDSFTVEAWVRSATNNWNKDGWFASSREANGFIFHPDTGTGTTVRGFVYDDSGEFHSTAFVDVGAGQLQDFHHYVFTYEAVSDVGILYLDGQPVVTTMNVLGDGNSRSAGDEITIWVGRDQFGTDRYGLGQIDELAIYGSALAEERIAAHYHAGSILLGDVNLDGAVDLLDVAPFVDLLNTGGFLTEADMNYDGVVNLLDVAPFVDALSS